MDTVEAGQAKNILVVASDSRLAAPQSRNEQRFGDGAAAMIVGSSDIIAEIEGSYCLSNEFVGEWRAAGDRFVHSWEDRFVLEMGYAATMRELILGIMNKYVLTPKISPR